MKKFIKSFFRFCIIMISMIVLTREIWSLDELWNYNFARNIVIGKIPYLDFNLVTFPLFQNLLAIFLKIFGQELFIYRIFQIIVFVGILYFSLKLFEKLNIKKIKSYVALLVYLIFIIFYYVCEYNVFCLFLMMILINLELSENIKKDFLIGILVGTAILTKQSIGICLLFIILLKSLFIDKSLKKAGLRFIGATIMFGILILYLYFNNCISQFLNYTIFGLKDFSKNNVSYMYLILNKNYLISLIAFLMIFVEIYILFKIKSKIKDKNFLILFLYSLANLTFMVPIMDEAHFLLANFINIIILIYLLNNEKNITEEMAEKFSKIINIFCVILLIYFALLIFDKLKYTEFNHYKYINPGKYEIKLNEVLSFMKENPNTYIFNAEAILYMVPADKYNGVYDMLLVGNLGKDGENLIKNEVKNLKDKYILISKINNWQTNMKIIDFVKENYEYIGNVAEFDIYKIK